jgi:uncharacterized protein (TIGR00251 family)
MSAAWRSEPGGVLVFLRVTPNAAADRIEGTETRDDGSTVLRLRVTAVPDKGKANAAVIALLAKAVGVPRSAITLVSGETARLKTVRIAGNAIDLSASLERLALR